MPYGNDGSRGGHGNSAGCHGNGSNNDGNGGCNAAEIAAAAGHVYGNGGGYFLIYLIYIYN